MPIRLLIVATLIDAMRQKVYGEAHSTINVVDGPATFQMISALFYPLQALLKLFIHIHLFMMTYHAWITMILDEVNPRVI